MDEQQKKQLMQLLQDAGLGNVSQYFTGGLDDITKMLGLQGPQASQFGQYFQEFNPQTYFDLSAKSEESRDIRSGMLSERLGEQLQNLRGTSGTEAGQTRAKFREMGGTAGFSGGGFGAFRREQEQSISDILGQSEFKKGGYQSAFERGGIASEEQYGRERGGIFSALQAWFDRIIGRAQSLYGLDPQTGQLGGGGTTGGGSQSQYVGKQ